MTGERLDLKREDGTVLWARQEHDAISLVRTELTSGRDTILATLDRDSLRGLLAWADAGRAVTVTLTGPLAREVRRHAQDLSLAPEMFVSHAVRAFLEAAGEASGGH